MENNAAFLISMCTSGKLEDLSIFKNKDQGIASLIETKLKVNRIISPPDEPKYKDKYETSPQVSAVSQESQSQQQPVPPEPAPPLNPLQQQVPVDEQNHNAWIALGGENHLEIHI